MPRNRFLLICTSVYLGLEPHRRKSDRLSAEVKCDVRIAHTKIMTRKRVEKRVMRKKKPKEKQKLFCQLRTKCVKVFLSAKQCYDVQIISKKFKK